MAISRKKPVAASKPPRPAKSKAELTAPKAPAAKALTKPAAHQPIGLEEIKVLIALAGREPFQEFEFEAGDMRFRIRKDGPPPLLQGASPAPLIMAAHAPLLQVGMPTAQTQTAPAEDPGVHYVTSPIVGTFYRAPNPTAQPFVSPGDFVKPGQTLCIIEAMKLMNEIESDIAGEVIKLLVENGQPVEYGERLFAVRIG